MDKAEAQLNWSFVCADVLLSLHLQQLLIAFLHRPSGILLAQKSKVCVYVPNVLH